MSSSIEEEFQPPEWSTKEEVIKAAQHYINYWKIEARSRNQQWLDAMEREKNLKDAGRVLSKEVMVVMLNGGAHEELINAHAKWKDTIDGKPNWGKTCKK